MIALRIEELKEAYLNYNQTLSPTTLRNYEWAFNQIMPLWNQYPATDVDRISREEVQQFLSILYDRLVSKHRPREGYPKGYTSYYYLKMFLKRLFRFIAREDIVKVLRERKLESPDMRPLSFEEIKIIVELLEDIHRRHGERVIERQEAITKGKLPQIITNPTRDRNIILTLFSSGLRATELCRLRVGDILFESKIGKVKGKGRIRKKDNFYFLFNCHERLEQWLGERVNNKDEFVFLDNSQRPFTYYNLWKLIKVISEFSGYNFTAHTFRHSIGVYLVKNGWTPETIRKFLRHRQIETTGIYLREIGERDVLQASESIRDRL